MRTESVITMASIFKRTEYAPLPAKAVVEVTIVRGREHRIARWTDADGKEQRAEVNHHRRFGDRVVLSESRCWYVAYQGEHGRRYAKAYSDRAASLALGERLERDAARRREGLVDRYDDHLKTSIDRHLADFLASRPAQATCGRHNQQLRNRITRIITGIKATRLQELEPVAIERFLGEQKIVGHTRNEYVANIKSFSRWAVESGRLRSDPLALLKKTPRSKIENVHPRRALSREEIIRLLDAALSRPLVEKAIVRTGKNKGNQIAKVHPRVKARMERLGRERRLCYLLALWAGLRRSEVKLLRWDDLHLVGPTPYIQLRAATTKAKRADTLVIHPELAEALIAARKERSEGDRVVRTVPDMKAFRADLKYAQIPEGDEKTGYVDFHSLRKTLSTMMASAGMSQRVRQSHMRHTDPRLTENTYMDERLLPIAQELAALPPIMATNTPTKASSGATAGATLTARAQQKTVVLALDLTPADYSGQEPIGELRVRGPLSQLESLQRVAQALAGNDKARHHGAPGH